MISFFRNKEKENDTVNNDKSYSNIAALLIHVAKIDENYEDKEKRIIKKNLIEVGAESSKIDKLISDASVIEENSNQILNFTTKSLKIFLSSRPSLFKYSTTNSLLRTPLFSYNW